MDYNAIPPGSFAADLQTAVAQLPEFPQGSVTAPFATMRSRCMVVLTPDGSGAIFEEEENFAVFEAGNKIRTFAHGFVLVDRFAHDLDLAGLARLPEEDRQVAIENWFYEVVNPGLEDPLYRSRDEMPSQEITFEQGSEEELERLIRLAVLSDPECPDETVEIWITTGHDGTPASISDGYLSTKRLMLVADWILNRNDPVGFKHEYNDGAHDRKSGYSLCGHTIHYEIDPPSAHERLAAIAEFRAWLDTVPAREMADTASEHAIEPEALPALLGMDEAQKERFLAALTVSSDAS